MNAYDPTIAPICKGKSNCPTQFGRKPGIIAEPAAGFIFALHLPVGNPSDVRYVVPLVDQVEQAIARVGDTPPLRPSTRSRAIWRSMMPPCGRHCMRRGSSRWGSPGRSIPSPRRPRRRTSSGLLDEADLHHIRTPSQVHLAYACGYSRPVVESIIASLLCRGAGHLTYKGHRGAIVQMGMAVMAHNAATLVRIHEYHLVEEGTHVPPTTAVEVP